MNKIFKLNKESDKDKIKDKYLIKALLPKDLKIKPFATMDLETINIDGDQHPISISSYNGASKESKLFIVDYTLLKTDCKQSVINMFTEYFNYISGEGFPKVVFVHNLGNFDGYFLYKYLLEFDYQNTNCIIDKANEFIEISYSYNKTEKKRVKINFRDSFRVFPISLDKLCKNFGVTGKTSDYDLNFNNISLFDNPDLFNKFKVYAIQDTLNVRFFPVDVREPLEIFKDYQRKILGDREYESIKSLKPDDPFLIASRA